MKNIAVFYTKTTKKGQNCIKSANDSTMDEIHDKLDKPRAEDVKNIILNTTEPVVFKNLLEWKILSWNLNDWSDRLGDQKLQFRCGHNKHTEV